MYFPLHHHLRLHLSLFLLLVFSSLLSCLSPIYPLPFLSSLFSFVSLFHVFLSSFLSLFISLHLHLSFSSSLSLLISVSFHLCLFASASIPHGHCHHIRPVAQRLLSMSVQRRTALVVDVSSNTIQSASDWSSIVRSAVSRQLICRERQTQSVL